MQRLWSAYAISAWVTLLALLVYATVFTIATPAAGMKYAFKLFWLNNLYMFIGLAVIGIFAIRKSALALICGALMLYPLTKMLYKSLFVYQGVMTGTSAWLMNFYLVTSALTVVFFVMLVAAIAIKR